MKRFSDVTFLLTPLLWFLSMPFLSLWSITSIKVFLASKVISKGSRLERVLSMIKCE